MMEQLLLHLIGDYVTQSDWMARMKTKQYFPAFVHATIYALPFLLLRPSGTAFAAILGTHFLIDRFALARYVVWAKNALLSPRVPYYDLDGKAYFIRDPRLEWRSCKITGYPADTPIWLATWLTIIADNTLHLTINYLALRFL